MVDQPFKNIQTYFYASSVTMEESDIKLPRGERAAAGDVAKVQAESQQGTWGEEQDAERKPGTFATL